jgi:hypothetical protein
MLSQIALEYGTQVALKDVDLALCEMVVVFVK